MITHIHTTPIRVYYEDTDAGGIVYYANYFKYAERGRTELLRELGVTSSGLMENENTGIVVRHVSADFHTPARLDDMLEVQTAIEEVKNASMIMIQRILKGGLPLVTIVVKLACIVVTTGKPVRLPKQLTDRLNSKGPYNEQ